MLAGAAGGSAREQLSHLSNLLPSRDSRRVEHGSAAGNPRLDQMELPALLTPVREVERRPDPDTQADVTRYVRSFLSMRLGVGVLGVLLPILLVFLDKALFEGSPFPRGSLSAYYYSGMRDVFVGIMASTGVFLFTYKIAERNLDNAASLLAGICAGLIALFPTGRPSSAVALTPLQDLLSEGVVKTVHFTASAGFLVSLGVLSWFFGFREGKRPRRQGTLSPTFWKWFHWACTIAMGLAILWIIVTLAVGWPPRALLIGEWVSVWAFGTSWLAKGAELDVLFGTPRRPDASQGLTAETTLL